MEIVYTGQYHCCFMVPMTLLNFMENLRQLNCFFILNSIQIHPSYNQAIEEFPERLKFLNYPDFDIVKSRQLMHTIVSPRRFINASDSSSPLPILFYSETLVLPQFLLCLFILYHL